MKILKLTAENIKHLNIELNFDAVCEEGMERNAEYIRISEYVDVEFQPISDEPVVNNHVRALKSMKTEIQAATQVKLNSIDEKIGKLLALTCDTGPVSPDV